MKIHSLIPFKSTLITLFSLILILGSVVVSAEDKIKPTTTKFAFVHSAANASLAVNRKETNSYTLVLMDVQPYITYFSERPNRQVGTLAMNRFLGFWNVKRRDSFAHNPPNAAIIATDGSFFSGNKTVEYIVDLRNPSYDRKSKTLTYTIKILKGSEVPGANSISLKRVILFIDDVCLSCWGFIN